MNPLLISDPHWLFVVIFGLILGAVSREVIPRLKNIIISKVHHDPIKGKWHSAHLTYNPKGELVVRHQLWEFIPNRWLGKLNLKIYGHENQLIFEGLVESTEENYRFAVEGIHSEVTFHRLKKVYQDQKETYGLWLGVDYRGKMVAAARFLSRDKIDDENFREWATTCYQKHSSFPIISAGEQYEQNSAVAPQHFKPN